MKLLVKHLSYYITQIMTTLLIFNSQFVSSQVRSSGNIFISKKIEAAIHTMPLRMTNSSRGSLTGVIGTERTGRKGYLSFTVPGLIIGGSDSTYIDGYAKIIYIHSSIVTSRRQWHL